MVEAQTNACLGCVFSLVDLPYKAKQERTLDWKAGNPCGKYPSAVTQIRASEATQNRSPNESCGSGPELATQSAAQLESEVIKNTPHEEFERSCGRDQTLSTGGNSLLKLRNDDVRDLSDPNLKIVSAPAAAPNIHFGRDDKRERDGTIASVDSVASVAGPQAAMRWYAPCQVNGTHIECLIDAGASCSVLDSRFYESLKEKPILRQTTRQLQGFGDSNSITPRGRGVFEVKLGSKPYQVKCVVASNPTDAFILGLDFQREYGGILYGQTGLFRVGGQCIWCTLKRSVPAARVQRSVCLPANSISWIPIECPNSSMDPLALVESAGHGDPMQGILVDTLVGAPNETTMSWTVPILNANPQTIELCASQALGAICSVKQAEDLCWEGGITKGIPGGASKTMPRQCPEHLLGLVTNSQLVRREHIDVIKRDLCRNSDVFMGPSDVLGQTNVVTHKVNTENHEPIRLPYRRLPLSKLDVMEQEVNKMLERNIISPSESPWSSPVVMVTKKDGSIRFCVDYRKINEYTVKDAYPIPRMDEYLDFLSGNKWFCTLDLESGYWQIKMDEADKEKTAFSTCIGLYQFNVMPFGLCNAPATFERMMERMLKGLKWRTCLIYIDDVIIFGKTFEETRERLNEVLARLPTYGLKLKPKKCELFKRQIRFLGRIISNKGIESDPEKLAPVRQWPPPQTPKQAKSFIGFCSYYREFIPRLADLIQPIQELAKLDPREFRWNVEADKSFVVLKTCLTSPPILAYPQAKGQFILDTDASGIAIAAVLSQMQKGRECVIAYASNLLNKAQRNYCATYRELLAVKHYVQKFKCFLMGSDFIIRTDHSSLKWLMNFKNAEGILARWLVALTAMGITDSRIVHRPGKMHVNADALSRVPRKCVREDCPDCQEMVSTVQSYAPLLATELAPDTRENIILHQDNDPDIRQTISLRKTLSIPPSKSERGSLSATALALLDQWDRLSLKGGILYRKKFDSSGRILWQIVLPLTLRAEVFELCHSHLTSGHFGVSKVQAKIAERFYWPGYAEDIARWVSGCRVCAVSKPGVGKGNSPLIQEITGVRFTRIAVDILTHLLLTQRGNLCMLVIQDYFTKYADCYPMSCHTAEECARKVVLNWVLPFGCPLYIHSDKGREFESKLWTEMCSILNIEKTRTNSFRPQSDGLVERWNRTLLQSLRAFCTERKEDWDELAPFVAHAYRASKHASTGCTPNLLVFGEEIRTPVDLLYGTKPGSIDFPCTNRFVEELRQAYRKAGGFARERLLSTAVVQKRNYDLGTKARFFQPGTWVYRYYPPIKQHKLCGSWDGPFEVIKQLSGSTFLIRNEKGKELNWHGDLLKPVKGPGAPKQVKIHDPTMTLPMTEEISRQVADRLSITNPEGLRRSQRE